MNADDVRKIAEEAMAANGHAKIDATDLGIRSLAELIAEEANAPDPHSLVEQVLRSDDYGPYAGKPKVGKTWLASEFGISIATGTKFVDNYETHRGRVLFFAGEGGRSRTLRRLSAVAAAKGIELGDIDDLRVSLKAPAIHEDAVRQALADELERWPADLIIGEPFYLMGRGVGRGQLNEIGAVLYASQEVAQDAGSALLLGDHWNKGGEGIGAQRITGAGMHEWGRVLINGIVTDQQTDLAKRATSVDVRWDVAGELADFGFKIRRQVRPTDPNDPASPLIYSCQFLGEHDPSTTSVLSEEANALLRELRAKQASESRPAKSNDIRIAAKIDGRRASDFWKELEQVGMIDRTEGQAGKSFDVWLTQDED